LLLGVVTRSPNESHGVQGVAGSHPGPGDRAAGVLNRSVGVVHDDCDRAPLAGVDAGRGSLDAQGTHPHGEARRIQPGVSA